MRQAPRSGMAFVALAAIGLVGNGSASGQETRKDLINPSTKPAQKGERAAEHVAGVILKVEDLAEDAPAREDSKKKGTRRGGKRLTLNTAVVWDDWVRDQAPNAASESPKEAAREGENSIATEGQPRSPDTLVTLDVGGDVRVETRYRLTTDQASEGASTPAAAREAQKDPADTSPREGEASRKGDEPAGERFDLGTLKPGLWVEADYRHQESSNRARRIVVLRPVNATEDAAEVVTPGDRPASKKAMPKKAAPKKERDDR